MWARRIMCGLAITASLFVGAGPGPALSSPALRVKEPLPPVAGQRVELPAAQAQLIAALADAKRDGDAATADQIARMLGWRAAEPSDWQPEVVIRSDRSGPTEKWGGDVRVNQPAWPSAFPALACRSDGTFYAAVDDRSGNFIDLYISYDGGETWNYELSYHDALRDLRNPSLAIGEGVHDRLLLAYDATRVGFFTYVVVAWRDFGDESFGSALVDSVPAPNGGIPRICVDCPEHSVWYAYLSYGSYLPGEWLYDVLTSRTLTYGETWENPTLLAENVLRDNDHAIDFGNAGLFSACASPAFPAGVQVRQSNDFGWTWGPPTDLGLPASEEQEPNVAVSNFGSTAVVSFAVDYGGGDFDIEAFVTTDGGNAWNYSWLPYTGETELGSTLTVDPLTGTIHAAYTRGRSVVTTQAAYADPENWSLARRVNEEQAVMLWLPVAAAADPSGARGLGVAWTDLRVCDNVAVYFDAGLSEASRAIEYLVICPQALREPAAHLAHYRELTGFGVELITLEEMGPGPPNPELIDAVIEDFAVSEPRLRYVTLIGAVDLLPGFPVDDGTDQWFSDLPYADIDGDYPGNYLPDIAVGRIPVHEPDQLLAYIGKVKDYELSRRHRNRVLFFGDLPEMSYVANRDSLLAVEQGFDVVTLYSPDESALLAALNDPSLAMVLYYGHGTFATNWPLHLGNLDLWLNDGRPVLYFSGGCNFNDNTIEGAPMGYELLTRPGCAAAAVGATVNGGYGYAYDYVRELLFDFWRFKTVGELHRYTLAVHAFDAEFAGQDVSPGSWVHYFTERMMCHGDPALRIDGDVTPVPDTPRLAAPLVRPSPNPFNPRTSLHFDLPARAAVTLIIYDLRGRVARVLVDGEVRDAGPQTVPWDGRDEHGRDAPSGTYIARLKVGSTAATSKLALVR